MMKNLFLVALALASSAVAAQDLLITNARIIDGTGRVIENGSVLVNDDRIVSVTGDDARIDAALVIDAGGMPVIPGLINTHWHLLGASGDGAEEAVREFVENSLTGMLDSLLARGVTTIMSAGDNTPDIFELRQRLADGQLRGPRLLAVGSIFTSPNDWPTQICAGNTACVARVTNQVETPAEARAKVAELAAAGADAIKLIYDDIIIPNARMADDVVAAITDEASMHGLTVYAHVSTTTAESALTVVENGVGALAHLVPPPTSTNVVGTDTFRRLEIPVATTIISTPALAAITGQTWTEENEAMYRNRLEILRSLHDAGVTLAFGTDSLANNNPNLNAVAAERFYGEAQALSEIMSNADVLTTMTRNAAVYLELDDQLGTLEPGKIADIVIIDGDPLADIDDLRNVAVVIQAGNVVVDNR